LHRVRAITRREDARRVGTPHFGPAAAFCTVQRVLFNDEQTTIMPKTARDQRPFAGLDGELVLGLGR
jgi:hypothetical protein